MDNLIKEKVKADMILVDPPYGTVKGITKIGMEGKVEWDDKLDIIKMYMMCEKLLREKGCLCIFSQDPFTYELIKNQNTNLPFSYRYVWIKDHFANGLMSKKAPVNYYEDICVFFRKYDIYNENPLRLYFDEILKFIGVSSCKDINKILGHRKAEHCFYVKSSQFKLCTEKVYDELVDVFHLKDYRNFKSYNLLSEINKKYSQTFNLPIDKKVKSNVLQYKKDYDGFHPTQKPIGLLKDLVSTYTKENEIIIDFTMGSGSTGVAALELNRKFIGIELDERYFNIAEKRIKSVLAN